MYSSMDQQYIFQPYEEELEEERVRKLANLRKEIEELHTSFSILNTIVESQEEDIESIHEELCMTTKAVIEAQQTLTDAESQASSYRFTNVSLGAMTGVLFAAGIELVLPGSGILSGALIGGLSGLWWK